MIIASHFHDQIADRAQIALLLLVAGLALGTLALWRGRRRGLRIGLVAVALVPLGFGAWQAAEAGGASHNHLCHAHNSDSCGHTHDEDGHIHRMGGWAAEQEEEL